MISNSKLSRSLLPALAAMAASFEEKGGEVHHFADVGVTVAIRESTENTFFASVAVASGDEKKFRPKVGSYLALSRMQDGEGVQVSAAPYDSMEDAASMLAGTVGDIEAWDNHPDRGAPSKGYPFPKGYGEETDYSLD